MSGHSKWSNIKRKKEAQDKVKGSTFSKLSRFITLAVGEGGGVTDPALNVRLRLAIDKAKEFNMPKDTIARAVEKGSSAGSSNLKQVMYEGFGPGGVMILIEAATDNPNRILTQVRNTIERMGGKLAGQGAVSYSFQKCGTITFNKSENDEETILEFAETIDGFDMSEDDESTTIFFPYEKLGKVHEVIGDLKGSVPQEEYKPSNLVQLNEKQEAQVMTLLESLENLDEVQNVYTNIG